MFTVQFDPEETKRQAQLKREKAILSLQATVRGGFWKYMRRGLFISLAITIGTDLHYILQHGFHFYRLALIYTLVLPIYAACWRFQKSNLKKLQEHPDITYDQVILPKGSGMRLFWIAVAGFAVMIAILYVEMIRH